ncbi:MAG: hypothetical protein V1928_04325 [Parcubacteria group bacterium]
MNLENLKKAGIRFNYCRQAVVPEIPRVQDVLYAMKLSPEQINYDFCVSNHSIYVANVGLAIFACGNAVLGLEKYDETEARKIIAKTILDLCPDIARCLFNNAFVEARKLALQLDVPKAENAAALRKICGCPECKQIDRELGIS